MAPTANNRFNEAEWLRLLFLLSDMQSWLSEMEKDLFMNQPSSKRKKLFQKRYYLTASSFAHILERHYYKIPRHIGAAKFTISVPEILDWLRSGSHLIPRSIPGSCNFARELETTTDIGFDRGGTITSLVTIITDKGGKIVTAFPGSLKRSSASPLNDDDFNPDNVSTVQEEETAYAVCLVSGFPTQLFLS